MRRPTVALALVLEAILVAPACAPTNAAVGRVEGGPPAPTGALAVDSALVAMSGMPLWPGFVPLATPVAIFDGTRTYLFRHPSPPAGYGALHGRGDVVVRDGRDPAITANTSALLGGVPTATVMLDTRRDPRELAALTVHELFHVFQRAKHPSWQANEADLFTYPVEDSAALALRREETSDIARAIAARSTEATRCWAGAFTEARRRRFALVGPAAAAYERGTELNEGLARYVERRAVGAKPALDATDPPAAQVRLRAYGVGAATAEVLDRIRPDWRDVLERTPDKATPPLDSLLSEASPATSAASCAADPAQRARWAAQAGEDVRALVAERGRARDEFLRRPGWRIVVESEAAPFFPAGFDPLNVTRLSPSEILHTRFLKLQGTRGTIEVLGAGTLTEGVRGQHPLFNGVVRLTITGLAAPPSMSDSAGVLAVNAAGVVIRLRGAKADVVGDTIRLAPR